MPRYLVIPRDDASEAAALGPREMQEIVERYHAWTLALRAEGALQVGEKLADGAGRVLEPSTDGVSVTDGPFAEANEVIGGFWIVEARDLDHATDLVSDCPHLERGSLEIRPIEELDLDG